MRIFLICLSLLYVLGVSYTQRFSMGGPSCDQAGSGWIIENGQISALSQQDDQIALATSSAQRHFGGTQDLTGVGGHAERGQSVFTVADTDPC